jgi:glutaconyl-CoA/methylmalonyl-CoA decarboxylase subunit gamma
MAKMTLKLPKAAVSMQEGKIVEWFVPNGGQVTVGQKLYLLETEKTTMEVDSPFAGTVTVLGQVGTTYAVGHPIAEINT